MPFNLHKENCSFQESFGITSACWLTHNYPTLMYPHASWLLAWAEPSLSTSSFSRWVHKLAVLFQCGDYSIKQRSFSKLLQSKNLCTIKDNSPSWTNISSLLQFPHKDFSNSYEIVNKLCNNMWTKAFQLGKLICRRKPTKDFWFPVTYVSN